jgi:CheY-like chemotaxis protein
MILMLAADLLAPFPLCSQKETCKTVVIKLQPFVARILDNGMLIRLSIQIRVMGNMVVGVFVDDRVEHIIFENIFQQLDHKLHGVIFRSPEEGFAKATTMRFDIVFIEMHYWGENFGGISILHHLAKISGSKPFAVAFTSLIQAGDLEKIMNAGFSMCLEKPLDINFFRNLSRLVAAK